MIGQRKRTLAMAIECIISRWRHNPITPADILKIHIERMPSAILVVILATPLMPMIAATIAPTSRSHPVWFETSTWNCSWTWTWTCACHHPDRYRASAAYTANPRALRPRCGASVHDDVVPAPISSFAPQPTGRNSFAVLPATVPRPVARPDSPVRCYSDALSSYPSANSLAPDDPAPPHG